jgi:TMEM175 potassium channel family protein
MPNDEDPADVRQFASTTRLEAFSDGVFAIAITLLVLEIALRPPGSPLEQVLHAWPSYLAYVVSFLTIGAAWLGHNEMTDRLERADQILLRINLLLLLVVVFLPFPTRLVAESLHDIRGERVFVIMYGLTLLGIRIFGFALDEYSRREHLDSPEGEMQEWRAEPKLLSVIVGYVIALVIGLVFPGLAVAAYFAIAVYLVVPFREVTRLLFPGSQPMR